MPNGIILFNPRSASRNHRIPNSILQVGASIHGSQHYVFVDGNRETDPWSAIDQYLKSGDFKYLGMTVMPGPQLEQAIPYSQKAKDQNPDLITIWGGYFPSNQYKVCIESPFVDFIVDGPGDRAFPALLNALEQGHPLNNISNLIYLNEQGKMIRTQKEELLDQDELPALPYDYLNQFYSIDQYLARTFLGKKTLAYHSSVGCPFKCSFCAVVPIYNARWKGKNAFLIYDDIKRLKDEYGIDAIEFHDNNFFVSENRVKEFSKLMINENISWWGEGRIDTIDRYQDETLRLMKDSGCKMIFFGAESGNAGLLKTMDKGGKQSPEQIKSFAARLKKVGIIPEYSFVLGFPANSPHQVMQHIQEEIEFIKDIKRINPQTEIIIYVYSPVPTEGSELFDQITKAGFSFPKKLEDWLAPDWQQFDLRKNPLTPWLKPQMINAIKDFETVLNAYYPTISDTKLSLLQRKIMRLLSYARYRLNWYAFPYELKLLQKFWLRYRQPEIEGF